MEAASKKLASRRRKLAAGALLAAALAALAFAFMPRTRSAGATPGSPRATSRLLAGTPLPSPRATVPSAPDPSGLAALPAASLARLRQTPDLTQTDPALALPGGGESHCAPVAVSNALMWLVSQGFDRLAPAGDSPAERQIALTRLLSTHRFLGTNEQNGTGARSLLRGLHRYLEQTGHAYKRLRYQGWRAHSPRFATGVKTPEMSFIHEGLRDRSITLVNVGWYKPSKDLRFFARNGGHWMTVVGAGFDERGAPAPDVIVLHDPAPYAGSEFAAEFARLEPLDGGWLSELKTALPARGFYRLRGGMHVKREGEMAVLDGVVALEL